MLRKRVLDVFLGRSLQGLPISALDSRDRREQLVGISRRHGSIVGAIMMICHWSRAAQIQRVNGVTGLLPVARGQVRRSIGCLVLSLDHVQRPMRHVAWKSSSERTSTSKTVAVGRPRCSPCIGTWSHGSHGSHGSLWTLGSVGRRNAAGPGEDSTLVPPSLRALAGVGRRNAAGPGEDGALVPPSLWQICCMDRRATVQA